MLRIFIDELPVKENIIIDLEKQFDSIEIKGSELDKSLIKAIDQGEYVDNTTFVYFDPPYRPLSVSSGFTSYTKEDFNDENQKELASYYRELDSKDAKLMLSNSNPKNTNKDDDFFEEIYTGFNINEVLAKRMINADCTGRGAISELLITNYEET